MYLTKREKNLIKEAKKLKIVSLLKLRNSFPDYSNIRIHLNRIISNRMYQAG